MAKYLTTAQFEALSLALTGKSQTEINDTILNLAKRQGKKNTGYSWTVTPVKLSTALTQARTGELCTISAEGKVALTADGNALHQRHAAIITNWTRMGRALSGFQWLTTTQVGCWCADLITAKAEDTVPNSGSAASGLAVLEIINQGIATGMLGDPTEIEAKAAAKAQADAEAQARHEALAKVEAQVQVLESLLPNMKGASKDAVEAQIKALVESLSAPTPA